MMIFTQEDLMSVIRQQMEQHDNQGDNEEWKEEGGNVKKRTKQKMKLVYEFVAKVDNPAAVAKIVRSAPLKKYALFTGVLSNIDIQMPVMIDGVAADALSEEFKVVDDVFEGLEDIDDIE